MKSSTETEIVIPELEEIIKANPPFHNYWSEQEVHDLKYLHDKGVPSKAIAKHLGRTISSVNNKIRVMGLSK